MKSLIVFIACISAVCAFVESPLCKKCKCSIVDNKIVVDCSTSDYRTDIITDVYNETSFVNNATGTRYEVDVLNLTSSAIEHLHKVLPASKLQILDLSDSDISQITEGAFQNLQEMVELHLGRNRLEKLNDKIFKGLRVDGEDYPLRSLKILYLNENRLHSIGHDDFQHIENNLTHLYLNGNPFKTIDLPTSQAILGLINLKVLDLSGTQISGLPTDFLHTPGFLEELYLGYNEITNVKSLGLQYVHVLKKLVLDGNPIVNVTEVTAFPKIESLKILHMCNMPHLEVIGNHSMCSLTSLEELYMTNNPKLHEISNQALIRIEDGSNVPVVQQLKKFYISDNKLSYLHIELDWLRLAEFDVNGNPWTCECENQWIADTLIPIYCKVNLENCKTLQCAAPIEMVNTNFYEIHEKKSEMRCLDYYGHRPEMDGIILVCFLLGLLLGIVLILGFTFAYKRHWFGLCDNSPANYSRQFYGRTKSEPEEFIP